MKYPQAILCGLLPACLALSVPAMADEWTAVGNVNAAANNTPAQSGSNVLYQELLLQNETMQQEIAQLRSQVEEQQHALTQLKQQQTQRYLDLDKRLSALLSQPTPAPIQKKVVASSNRKDANKLSADDLYDQAMAAIKARDFDSAISDFKVFEKKYGKHKLMANTLYWSGEAQYSKQDISAAEQSFKQLLDKYASHSKAPGAQYKLALIKAKQGKAKEAKALLEKVVANKKASSLVLRQAKKQLSKYSDQ